MTTNPKFDLREFTSEEQEALEYAAHAALARTNFSAFCTFVDSSYQRSSHIDLMAAHLEKVENGSIPRLMIIMPPGHSKSETASGKFPSWFIGRNPSRRVILTSYGATLAETFSAQNRDTIAHNPNYRVVFPTPTISSANRSADKWALHGERETMVAGGVGGAITGYRAHGLIIDDPVKNYEEAHSPAHQEMVYNWYKTTSRTRLFQDGWIILIMTHWAKGDLAGRILDSSEAGDWVVLHLPALSLGSPQDYDDPKLYADFPASAFPDPLGRPPGKPLWEEKFNLVFLTKTKQVMQDEFDALYQGVPGTPGGSKFRKGFFKGVTEAELATLAVRRSRRVRSWDLAWSGSNEADYTVGLKASLFTVSHLKGLEPDGKTFPPDAGFPEAFIVIEDVVRWRKEWDESEGKIKRVAMEDGRDVELLVEATASQSIGFKSLRASKALMRYTVLPVRPSKDKVARAQYPTTVGAKGMLYILQPNPTTMPEWADAFLNELADFPHGTNDDQVDTLTQVVNYWQPLITGFLQALVLGTTETVVTVKSQQELMRNRPHPFREDPGPFPRMDEHAWTGPFIN